MARQAAWRPIRPPLSVGSPKPHPHGPHTSRLVSLPGGGVELGGEGGGPLGVGDGGFNALQLLRKGGRWGGMGVRCSNLASPRMGQRGRVVMRAARQPGGRLQVASGASRARLQGRLCLAAPGPHLDVVVQPLALVEGAVAHGEGHRHGVAHKGGGNLLACRGEEQRAERGGACWAGGAACRPWAHTAACAWLPWPGTTATHPPVCPLHPHWG